MFEKKTDRTLDLTLLTPNACWEGQNLDRIVGEATLGSAWNYTREYAEGSFVGPGLSRESAETAQKVPRGAAGTCAAVREVQGGKRAE